LPQVFANFVKNRESEVRTIINGKMKVRALFLILVSLLAIGTLQAQKKNAKILISGSVTDASLRPVANAIVMIDGQNTSSITDANGDFKVKVKTTAKMIGVVSFANGMKEEAIDGRTIINFSYATSAPQQQAGATTPQGDQSVNTGYGVQKRSDATGPVKTIDGTDKSKNYATYSSVYEIIAREVGGVRVNGTQVIIMGSKDFFGDVPALLVLDGVPVDDYSGVSTSQVESISVLKGSSAAIYGTRGYGGAVVVTTKKENQ
jgi:TonB-dependent SusC/RagA subfamily outer membrane receptor